MARTRVSSRNMVLREGPVIEEGGPALSRSACRSLREQGVKCSGLANCCSTSAT